MRAPSPAAGAVFSRVWGRPRRRRCHRWRGLRAVSRQHIQKLVNGLLDDRFGRADRQPGPQEIEAGADHDRRPDRRRTPPTVARPRSCRSSRAVYRSRTSKPPLGCSNTSRAPSKIVSPRFCRLGSAFEVTSDLWIRSTYLPRRAHRCCGTRGFLYLETPSGWRCCWPYWRRPCAAWACSGRRGASGSCLSGSR